MTRAAPRTDESRTTRPDAAKTEPESDAGLEIETIHRSDNPAGDVRNFRLRFPAPGERDADGLIDQDEEWCEVRIGDTWRRIRFHDYHEVYGVPGLYEALFARRLKCSSPERVVGLFDDVLGDFPQDASDLRVLDIGAGNGMVGEEFRRIGVPKLLGIDIIPEAKDAAKRDRPEVYRDYLVADLTDLDDGQRSRIATFRPNAMSVVAALGYGDIPTAAFLSAASFVPDGGWLVFNIKEDFLRERRDESGFSRLIRRLQAEERLEIQAMRRYRHRLSMQGEPLHYVAIVARKNRDLGADEEAKTA